MNKTTKIGLIIGGVLLAAVALGGLLATQLNSGDDSNSDQSTADTSNQTTQNQTQPEAAEPSQPAGITKAELAQKDGLNGRECQVAVDGKVYQISGSDEWVNGVHQPSGGAAKCGMDLTSVIGNSPHGKSILSRFPVVGSLAN